MARVFGSVVDEVRRPLAGHTVTLETESLRGELASVACGTTDECGCYTIDYELKCEAPRLRVTLANPKGQTQTWRTFANISKKQRVDFRVGAALDAQVPVFADVARKLGPLLAAENVDLTTLDAVGTARAALSAGVHPAHAAALRRAMQSAAASGIAEETFLALGAGRASFDLAAALRRSGPARRRAVEGAIAAGALSRAQAQLAQKGLDALDAAAFEAALSVGAEVATPGLAFSLAGIEQDARRC